MTYISREAAIEALCKAHSPYPRRREISVRAIQEISPADVVEVVRCKDCAHRPIVKDVSKPYGFGITGPKENGYTDFTCPYLCDDAYYNRMPKDHWYCAEGEKRVEDGKGAG